MVYSDSRGFTLIEIIVAIAIVGILSVGATIGYQYSIKSTRDSGDGYKTGTIAHNAFYYTGTSDNQLPNPSQMSAIQARDGITFILSDARIVEQPAGSGKKFVAARYESAEESSNGDPYGVTYIMDYNEAALGQAVATGTLVGGPGKTVDLEAKIAAYPERLIGIILVDSPESEKGAYILKNSYE